MLRGVHSFAVLTVFLATFVAAAVQAQSYRDDKAERIATQHCRDAGGSPDVCACVLNKFVDDLTVEEYDQWTSLQRAGQGTTNLREVADDLDWSLEKTRRLNRRYVKKGMRFGTSCQQAQ